tara:strand:- start:535 stop:1128 length:594 start_codon:yes stop_codon:yes gene_type:complete
MTYKQKFNKKYGFKPSQSHSLEEISKITGYDLKGIKIIFRKGKGAYKTNPQSVRPMVKSPEQWAYARVYSAVMGGKSQKIDKSHLKKSKMIKTNNIFGIEGISKDDQEKLLKLYNKAFSTMPRSKKQDDIKKEIKKIESKYQNKKSVAKQKIKKKMNDYMKAKEKARKSGKKSFTYKGKTYTAKKTKTGMMIYKRKK